MELCMRCVRDNSLDSAGYLENSRVESRSAKGAWGNWLVANAHGP